MLKRLVRDVIEPGRDLGHVDGKKDAVVPTIEVSAFSATEHRTTATSKALPQLPPGEEGGEEARMEAVESGKREVEEREAHKGEAKDEPSHPSPSKEEVKDEVMVGETAVRGETEETEVPKEEECEDCK